MGGTLGHVCMASLHAKATPWQCIVTSLVSKVQCSAELPTQHSLQSSAVTFDGLQALAQDQLRALRQMCAAAFGEEAPYVEVYDGDTIRVNPPYLFTLYLVSMLLPQAQNMHLICSSA